MSARQPHELLAAALPTESVAMWMAVGASVIGEATVQTTDARCLHAFLGIGKDFSSWIKGRIEQYSFVENVDFVIVYPAPQNGGAGNRGARVEYTLTLDMAKELAMVERTPRGKEARQYYIECERRALAVPARPAELSRMDLIEMAMAAERERLAAEQARAIADAKVQKLEHQVADQAPAVAGFDRIANAAGTNTLSVAAKFLQLQPGQLIQYLLDRKWIFKRSSRSGASWYIAYQDRLDAKHLTHKYGSYQDPDTSEWKTKEQVLVTRKGVARLAEMLAADAVAERLAAEAAQHQQRLPLPGDDG